jgi:hypothetical protein
MQPCVVLHAHAQQDTDPAALISRSWAVKPSVRARFAWDQGLYTYELYPAGIALRERMLTDDDVCIR